MKKNLLETMKVLGLSPEAVMMHKAVCDGDYKLDEASRLNWWDEDYLYFDRATDFFSADQKADHYLKNSENENGIP